jgi:hypothetical protein
MKIKDSFWYALIFSLLFILTIGYPQSNTPANPDFKNYYGICWRGSPHENLTYARQMKYDYVFYQQGMENDALSNGLYFYLESPEYYTYDRRIDLRKARTPQQIDYCEKNFALKNASQSFPDNIATGWVFDAQTFTPILDFQQQKVIDFTVDSILTFVKKIESRNPKFHFGGFAWDVPQPAGDFWNEKKQVTLKVWTGGDYGITYPGVIHNYSTYSEGHIVFYNQLFKRTRAKYPLARFIVEPYKVYDEWVGPVSKSPLAKYVMVDIVSQEGYGTEFVDDTRIFRGGLINKSNMACSTPDKFGEADNRLLLAKAATNGALFNWYGRFGGTGDMPNFKSITEVPARLKLIREIANWENENGTPLLNRQWDGNVYKSDNAFASSDLISAVQPHTNKLFFVFLTGNGKLMLPKGKKLLGISRTNNFFIESETGVQDFNISGGVIAPRDSAILNRGYIAILN